MRYLKSWLFRVGLVLTVAGMLAAYFVKPVEISWVSSGGTRDFGFFRESADVNAIPMALTLSGLVMMAVATVRLKLTTSN
jgi:hypothetical protein